MHVHHYSSLALRRLLRRSGFDIIQLRSIRRSDSLAHALEACGLRFGRFRIFLRLLLLPVMPLLSLLGFGPELLCVAQLSHLAQQKAKPFDY